MNLLNDLTLQQIFTRILAYLIFAGAHGAILAGMATVLGARGPAQARRLTPNPMAHLSLWGLVMAIMFRVGWILPMQINGMRRWAMVLCALASLIATLALVPLVDLLRPAILAWIGGTAGAFIALILNEFQVITVASVALNALPLPLLTGRLFLIAALPAQERRITRAAPVFTVVIVAAMLLWLDTGLSARLLDAIGTGY